MGGQGNWDCGLVEVVLSCIPVCFDCFLLMTTISSAQAISLKIEDICSTTCKLGWMVSMVSGLLNLCFSKLPLPKLSRSSEDIGEPVSRGDF